MLFRSMLGKGGLAGALGLGLLYMLMNRGKGKEMDPAVQMRILQEQKNQMLQEQMLSALINQRNASADASSAQADLTRLKGLLSVGGGMGASPNYSLVR